MRNAWNSDPHEQVNIVGELVTCPARTRGGPLMEAVMAAGMNSLPGWSGGHNHPAWGGSMILSIFSIANQRALCALQ